MTFCDCFVTRDFPESLIETLTLGKKQTTTILLARSSQLH